MEPVAQPPADTTIVKNPGSVRITDNQYTLNEVAPADTGELESLLYDFGREFNAPVSNVTALRQQIDQYIAVERRKARISELEYLRGFVGGTAGRLAEYISGVEVLEQINDRIAALQTYRENK